MAIADLDLKPTAEMAANAERGLALREKHGKGGTAVGVARARDIKNRANLSPSTVKRMHSFFSRHEGNQKGGEDDAGYIAWLLWGGDAGKSWAARKVGQIDKSSNRRIRMAKTATTGIAVTPAEHAALVAAETLNRRTLSDDAYVPTDADRAVRKKARDAYAAAKARHDAFNAAWQNATTAEARAAVEARAAEAERGMMIWRGKNYYSRSGGKAAFAANNVDLWNFLARSDWTIDRQSPLAIAILRNYATRALKMPNFTPPSHQQHGPSLHDMARDALADIKKWEQDMEKRKNRAPWNMSRSGGKAAFGTNKRVIRYAGHQFLAEDEGSRTRISVKVDGEWEHATTVNTANQTATEWIEANAKPSHPSRWLPQAFSRSGGKAAFGRSLIASKGNKRIYLGGPDGSGRFNLYLVQVVNTGVPNEKPAEDLIEMKSFATEARARAAAQKMLSSRVGGKAAMSRSGEYIDWRGELCIVTDRGNTVSIRYPHETYTTSITSAEFNAMVERGSMRLYSRYSRSGGKAAFATVDEVLNLGSTLADAERAEMHGNTNKLRTLLRSVEALVNRDRAKLPRDMIGFYDELRRKANMSRARFARWEERHSDGWGDLSVSYTATINGTNWEIVMDASTRKGTLMRSTPSGPKVVREGTVDQLKRYAETIKASRSRFARWEESQTRKNGKPITEYTARIGRNNWMIEVGEETGGGVAASLYLWNDLRGMERVKTGRLQELQNYAESLSRKDAKGVAAVERRANYSRSGGKAAFAAEVVQKLSGGWVIEREGGILYLAKGSEAIPVPSVERAMELHKAYTEGRLMKQNIAGTKSRPFSRDGGKAAFSRLSPYIKGELAHAWEMADADGEKATADAIAAVLKNPTMENLKAHPLAMKELKYKLDIAKDNRDRSAVRSLQKALSSRAGAKAAFATDSIEADYLRDIAETKRYIEEAYNKGRASHALQLKAQLADLERHLAEYKARTRAKASRSGGKAAFSDPIANKISLLMDEGKDRDQAVAIALDMKKRGEL